MRFAGLMFYRFNGWKYFHFAWVIPLQGLRENALNVGWLFINDETPQPFVRVELIEPLESQSHTLMICENTNIGRRNSPTS